MDTNAQIKIDGDSFLCLEVAKSAISHFGASYITKVVIDRYQGLVLYGQAERPLVHCTGLICGYDGNGPITAAELLKHAGFGNKRKEVIADMHCEFTKP